MASVAQFLMDRLKSIGVKTVFGIPGDYVLDFYDKLWNNADIEVVNTTDEAHAGFAADAYARVHGVGCCCTTYNVGTLKVANAVACAYAERSPLIVISGSPGMKERQEGMLLHHMVRSFTCQHDVFSKITCAAVVLDDPNTAGLKIDQAFEALKHYKQPIYLELPRDVANKAIVYDPYHQAAPDAPSSDPENLKEALEEVYAWIEKAERPAILAGVELARYGLGEKLIKFAERTNIPVACELLSKSVINERHPLFAGIYSGPASREETRKLVDDSDCLLMFGVMLTDMTLNFRPAKFTKRQVVSSSVNGLQVRNHTFTGVQFADFCETLFNIANFTQKSKPELPKRPERTPFEPKDTPITTERMFEKIDSVLDKNIAIIADIGNALFGAGDLTVHHSNTFLSPAFYTTMGPAIPYSLGMMKAKPKLRPIVIVGDGAFQMSMTEISTLIQQKLNPVIIVLNNDGYSTERFLKDGGYNDLRRWDYHKVVDMFRGGVGVEVKTEDEFHHALTKALDSKELHVINVLVDRTDISSGMRRMAEALAKRV